MWRVAERVVNWVESTNSLLKTYSGVLFYGEAGGEVARWSVRYCGAAVGNWGAFILDVMLNNNFYVWTYFVYTTRDGNWKKI